MKISRRTLLSLMAAGAARGFQAAVGSRLEIVNRFGHPAFVWPRTLLSYPADNPGLAVLDSDSGNPVPSQLAGGRIHFFCDLPQGAARRFQFVSGPVQGTSKLAEEKRERDTIIVDAGALQVRIPASRTVRPGEAVPGPILQVNRGTGWMGGSRLLSPRLPVQRIDTERLDSGPLFTTCRITYSFGARARYIATVRCVRDYDFIELSEEMRGIAKEDGIFIEQGWTRFHPTHRFSSEWPNFNSDRWTGPEYRWSRIDEPMETPYNGEDPAFQGPSRVEDPAREFLFRLAPYAPGVSWETRPHATFWDERSGDAMAVFIRDAAEWNDGAYSLWASADILQVRFRFTDGVLYWKWPLANGTRSTGIACYDHAKDRETLRSDPKRIPNTYAHYLYSRYGAISLDKVKEWVLSYPGQEKRSPSLFRQGLAKSAADLEKRIWAGPQARIPFGINETGGVELISQRSMYDYVVDGFVRFAGDMAAQQRPRLQALLLLNAYVCAGEEIGPMRAMFGGHPNFMADGKSVLPMTAFLFPEHPAAPGWLDEFEKFLELAGRFYVRPAVQTWEARGGRWTESLATYNWAFWRPVMVGNELAVRIDGRNRIANRWLAAHAEYLAGTLTAPVTIDGREQRIHPPQGAHSGKRPTSLEFWLLGLRMMRYRPMLAEAILWAANPAAPQLERSAEGNAWSFFSDPRDANRGTNPHLESAKFTGYGIVMRAGQGEDEISVFLQQIDIGPNYRWGFAGEGGCGAIYYYAGGKSYSGHLREDAGDRRLEDATFSCNFAVYKDHRYKSIGMNDLERPFYNLEVAQWAELTPRQGPGAYAWPEYESRSLLLVGRDYFVVRDAIEAGAQGRFAWSIGEQDEWPNLHQLSGPNQFPTEASTREGTRQARTVWHEGQGDSVMLVTHKSGVAADRGVRHSPYLVKTSEGTDLVFCGREEVHYDSGGVRFDGRIGVVRQKKDGSLELALFQGTRAGTTNVTLLVDGPDLGVSLVAGKGADCSGKYFGRHGGRVTLEFLEAPPAGSVFFVDGARVRTTVERNRVSAEVPAGEHRWQFTARPPSPMPPAILRTVNRSGASRVFFQKVAGAERYRLELSYDHGTTWAAAGEGPDNWELTGLPNGGKVHVRAIALNGTAESLPGHEYPIYVTDRPPLPPDGLRTEISEGKVRLEWGEVPGTSEYRLYRRRRGTAEFVRVFAGLAYQFSDRPAGGVFEYAVAAVNGNGEGPRSPVVDNDPASWRNWEPSTDLRFKRRSAYVMPPYVDVSLIPPEHYPE
jgi:hypothetical protein